MKKVILTLLSLISFSFSKEILTEDKLKIFLIEENPNIYSIIGKKYIYEGKVKYFKSNFDTYIGATYEDKDYPLSEAKYYEAFIKQPLHQGFDLKFGYRKAKGVQEYNNIKTSDKGEALLNVKLPIIKVLSNIDERRLNLYKYRNLYERVDFETQEKLRKFYLKVIKTYYKAVYYKKSLALEKKLLEKAEKRFSFIKRKIEEGLLPEIYIVEAKQQIINRKQRVLKAENEFNNSLNELSYLLGITVETLKNNYELPEEQKIPEFKLKKEKLIELAKNKRPDLKVLKTQLKIYNLEEKYYSLFKYPDINLDLYTTKDLKYGYGFKVALNIGFYMQRRKFLGKFIEIKKGKVFTEKKIKSKLNQIKTKIENLINTLKTLEENIKIASQELNLVKKLEEAEKKRFLVGQSDLFYLNQREIYTLKTYKKLLKYKFDYFKMYKKLLITTGNY